MPRQIIFGIIFLVLLLAFFSISCDKDSTTEPKTETITVTKISGDRQAGVPGDTLSVPLTFLVNGNNGNILSGKRIDFKVLSGSASLSDSIVITNDTGKASTLVILGDKEGDVTVEAKVFGTDYNVIFNLEFPDACVVG